MTLHIDYNAGDPEPSNVAERQSYVTRSAVFFREIGGPKLNFMVNDLLRQLMDPTLTERQNQDLKLTINALSLFLDWGDRMISEDAANRLPEGLAEDDAFNTK